MKSNKSFAKRLLLMILTVGLIVVVALMGTVFVSAADTGTDTKTIYLSINGQWTQKLCAVYTWGSDYDNGQWIAMKDTYSGNDLWTVEIPAEYTNINFCSRTAPFLGQDSVKNQTGNLTIPADCDHFTLTGESSGVWDKYNTGADDTEGTRIVYFAPNTEWMYIQGAEGHNFAVHAYNTTADSVGVSVDMTLVQGEYGKYPTIWSAEISDEYTNIDFQMYEEPNRVMIVSDWGETTVATVKRNTQVRYRGGVKSPILTEVSKKDIVTVIEDEDNWKKIRTEDGYVGYIKTNCLKNETKEEISRAFKEQVYPNISKDYTINLAWHVVTNKTANNTVLSMIADTKGLTTISPTWFTVADTSGNINSLASSQYVNYAHQSNIEVWGLVRDFDGGIGSYEESYELLSHTTNRENLINQLIAEALKTGLDGINVDFEKISTECGEHFIQFVRELSVKCRQNGIILSVDNYVPRGYNQHYNLKEQGVVADYVIIMGYDEHYAGSYESGPVASLDYVKSGIEEALKVVSKEKLINAVPFYTRLWKEVPKTEGELAAEEGTEAAEYSVKVTSVAYGMKAAEQVIATAGAQIVVDEETGHNYAQWEADGATYKIWLEDEAALEAKLKLMKENDLAGCAAWRLGYEKSDTWELILKYVN